jgi:hypothetical protein
MTLPFGFNQMDNPFNNLNSSNIDGKGTASDFASWVYRKYHPWAGMGENHELRQKKMKLGKAIHKDIERYKLWARSDKLEVGQSREWRLVFADTHDGSHDKIFLASRLQYDGSPLRCLPDLVLREENTGKIIIVERKVTTFEHLKRITKWGYARIRAQLWCYAWIDDWLDAPDVLMVCEWWADYKCSPILPYWWRSDQELQSECLKYFQEYGGDWVE